MAAKQLLVLSKALAFLKSDETLLLLTKLLFHDAVGHLLFRSLVEVVMQQVFVEILFDSHFKETWLLLALVVVRGVLVEEVSRPHLACLF